MQWEGVKDVLRLLARSLILLDEADDSLLDLGQRDLAFERLLLSAKRLLDLALDGLPVNQLVAEVLLDYVCQCGAALVRHANHDGPVDLSAADEIGPLLVVPPRHGLQPILLGEVRVYVKQREVVILDLNYRVLWLDLIGGVDYGADHGAGPLEFLRLVDDVREASQDELLAAISRVDNLSEHPHDGLGGDDLAGLHHG